MRTAVGVSLCLALALAGCKPKPTNDVGALTRERDRLIEEKNRLKDDVRAETRRVVVPPPEVTDEVAVVAAIPNAILEHVLTLALTDVADGLSLQVENAKFNVDSSVKVNLKIAKVTLGDFKLEVLLQEAKGTIAAGDPKVSIGEGRIGLVAPLKVEQGRGSAQLRFIWSGRGLVRRLCGDLDVTRDLTGTLKPIPFVFRGGASLGVDNQEFVIKPAIPPQQFQLAVEPSEASWKVFRKLIREQKGVCGAALQKVQVENKVRELLAEGFPVTVNLHQLKPIQIPVAVSHQLRVQDKTVQISATPALLEIEDPYTWFGTKFAAFQQ
jgi:hypothetical protein